MPIEILELVVKANISEEPTQQEAAAPEGKEEKQLMEKQLLTEEIVEQVLAILHHKAER